MPSTYTVNLGIEKPATGEQSGTWGDTTNVNFDILDQAINGAARVTLSSAGSSGSPNALIITNGAASDGRNKWIEFYSSGDLGGDVFVQLQPNDAEKIVFIRNSLAGSRSVLLFQGTYNSGRDLEISAGVDMVVKFDGGGASAANVTDVYNNLKVTGLVAGTADINGGTVDGTVIGGASAAALTATTVVANTSVNIAGDGATVTGIKDEDNMASNSATKLATQQSIKAYVDSQVGTVDTLAEILANGNTTGSTDIDVDAAQKVQFRDAAIYINSSVDGQLDIVADTEIQIAATTIDINGAIVASGEISAASLDISGDVDIDGTLNVDAIDIDGAVQLDNTLTVGVDDTGYDVKFYGATGGAYMLWDESADDLILAGAAGLSVAGVTTLASLVATTADINAGTIDGTVIGGTTAAAGSFTTFTSTGIDDNATSTAITIDSGENIGVNVTPEKSTGTWRNFEVGGANLSHRSSGANDAMLGTGFVFKTDNSEVYKNSEAVSRLFFNNNVMSFQQAGSGTAGNAISWSTPLTIASTGAATFSSNASADSFGFTQNSTATGIQDAIFRSTTGRIEVRAGNVDDLLVIDGTNGVIVNDGGANRDFRVESDTNTYALFVDAGADHVNIGTSSDFGQRLNVNGGIGLATDPTVTWTSNYLKFQTRSASVPVIEFLASTSGNYAPRIDVMNGAGTVQHRIDAGGATTFNETGADNDFRVESDGQTHMLHVDASANAVFVKTASIFNNSALSVGGTIGFNGQTAGTYNDSIGWIDFTDASNLLRLHSGSDAGESSALEISTNVNGAQSDAITVDSGGVIIINQDSKAERDFRVESDADTHMLFVDAGNNSVGIGTAATGSTALVVQASSGAGAISIIGRASGGIGTLSFYDDNGTSNVGYLQGRADDNEFRLWTTTADTLSLGQNDADRLQINNEGIITKDGHLGNSYTNSHPYWVISTFNDNATVTSGSLTMSTSTNEWQPGIFKVSAASIDTDQSDPGAAVWYVRAGFNGQSAGVINITTGFEDNSTMSLAVTATTVSTTSVLLNFVVTGTGNRTVGSVEGLAYGKIIDSARTG